MSFDVFGFVHAPVYNARSSFSVAGTAALPMRGDGFEAHARDSVLGPAARSYPSFATCPGVFPSTVRAPRQLSLFAGCGSQFGNCPF